MAIPDEPLRLSFDTEELTLDELTMFTERDAEFRTSVFKAFLTKYGNWTKRQLDGIQRRDIPAIFAVCVKALNDATLPKGKPSG